MFLARQRQIQDAAEFPIGKMSDSFFLLAWFQIEIDAAVMILAEFRMERREHFSQRFAMPGHQFRKEKRGNRGVALRQVEVVTEKVLAISPGRLRVPARCQTSNARI